MLVRCLRFRTSPFSPPPFGSIFPVTASPPPSSSTLLLPLAAASAPPPILPPPPPLRQEEEVPSWMGGEREWSASLPDGCGGERGEADVVAISLLLCPGGGGATARFSLRRSWGKTGGRQTTDGRTDGGGGAEEPLSLFPSSCSFVFVRRVMFLSAAGRERFLVGDSTTF